MLVSLEFHDDLNDQLKMYKIRLVPVDDPFTTIWTDRPALPDSPAEIFDIEYSGEHADVRCRHHHR